MGCCGEIMLVGVEVGGRKGGEGEWGGDGWLGWWLVGWVGRGVGVEEMEGRDGDGGYG